MSDKVLKILNGGLVKHLKIKHISNENKKIVMQLKVEEIHMAGTLNRVHAGTFSSICDTCIGFGSKLYLPKGASHFAVLNSSSNYLSFGKIGDVLTCTATQSHVGKSTQIWDAIVTCDDRVLSTTKSTVLNLYEDETKSSEIPNEKEKRLGLNFTIKNSSKEEIESKFDIYSLKWEEYVKFGKYNIFNWLTSNCQHFDKKEGNVLDLACGIGLITSCLKQNGFHGKFIGADISQGMIEKSMKTKNYNGGILKLDLDEKIPLDMKFDLITCFGATELLNSVDVFLSEVRRLLQGELWVSFQFDDEIFNPTEHQGIKGFTEKEIREKLKNFGFKILHLSVEREAYFTNHPTKGYSAVPYLMVKCE
jgi:1,4-dihydroxy-2-naphthoyl-CoA hydrolase